MARVVEGRRERREDDDLPERIEGVAGSRGGGEEEVGGPPDWRYEDAVAGGELGGREDAGGRRTELFGPG